MKKELISLVKKVRAIVTRVIKPKEGYFLFKFPKRSLKPISTKFGFDRGKPIDRYYIESFLEENKEYIEGVCLEITDNAYTKEFGDERVIKSDVLDIDRTNKQANIYGDLRNLKSIIAKNTYDCIILTHVLGMIDDYETAIREISRILKPGGVLLFTSSCFSPTYEVESNFWRFTPASTKYVFSKYFSDANLEVKSYGNALAGQAFWLGFAQEELSNRELEYNDPHFPCIVAARAVKEENKK